MKQFLLSLFFVPVPIIILFILSFFISNKIRIIKILNYSLVILVISSLPITSKLLTFPLNYFTPKYNNKNIDAILLLTGGINKNVLEEWVPSEESIKRALIAKKLSRTMQLPLIISGGKTIENAPSEAYVLEQYLNIKGSVLDEKSLNTYETAKNFKKIFNISKNKSLLIVTNIKHSLRSYLVITSNNIKCYTLDHDIVFHFQDLIPKLSGMDNFNKVLYEYIALSYYIITNKIKLPTIWKAI